MAVKTLSNLSISSMGTGTSGGATTNRSEWTSINFSTSVSAVTGGGAATETYTLQYSLDGGTTWIDLTTTTASTSPEHGGQLQQRQRFRHRRLPDAERRQRAVPG
jgi:hypothetical protein